MKNRNRSKLKRHPLIRFIRGIFRLFKVVFRPKKNNLNLLNDYQSNLDKVHLDSRDTDRLISDRASDLASSNSSIHLDSRDTDRLISDRASDLASSNISIHSDSRDTDRLITVGELFEQVKWQVPQATIIQEKVSDTSFVAQAHDVSRN
jgi:hypothetical protein